MICTQIALVGIECGERLDSTHHVNKCVEEQPNKLQGLLSFEPKVYHEEHDSMMENMQAEGWWYSANTILRGGQTAAGGCGGSGGDVVSNTQHRYSRATNQRIHCI